MRHHLGLELHPIRHLGDRNSLFHFTSSDFAQTIKFPLVAWPDFKPSAKSLLLSFRTLSDFLGAFTPTVKSGLPQISIFRWLDSGLGDRAQKIVGLDSNCQWGKWEL